MWAGSATATRRKVVGAIAVTAAWLVGGAAAQAAPAWDDVVAAAKKEGKVVVYVGAPTTPRDFGAILQKAYGIQVEMLYGRASEIRERIRTEQATGQPIADVLISGSTTVGPVRDLGFAQPHGGLPNAGKIVAPFTDDGTIIPVAVTRFGLLINTDLVKPVDEPKSWTDLIDPKWKGKILSDDPRAAGGGNGALAVLYDKYGPSYAEKFAAQKPVFSRDIFVNEQRVARGEFPIMFPLNIQDIVNLQGLPVKGIAPEEGVPYVAIQSEQLKGAPHPNAARLLLDTLLGPEYQQVLAERGTGSTVGVEPKSLPASLRPLIAAKLMGTEDYHDLDKYLKIFQEIFK